MLGAEKGAGEVHGELARPALERHVEHAVAAEDAGVVHQHVHGTVGRARLHDHRLHLALVGDVAHEAEGLPAAPPDRLRALLRVVGGHVHADDARALLGEPLGDAAADVGAGAGHDRDLVGELHVGATIIVATGAVKRRRRA